MRHRSLGTNTPRTLSSQLGGPAVVKSLGLIRASGVADATSSADITIDSMRRLARETGL
jgi:hypothetical protein